MAQILFKRGNSSNITSVELAAGEPALALDTGKVYVGDGSKKILINPDHVPSSQEAISLRDSRAFSIGGDVVASAVQFNGTGNVALTATLPTSGVQAGTHAKVTVNNKGIVTGSAALAESDIPALAATKIKESTDKKFVTTAEKQKIADVDRLITEGDTFNSDMLTVNGLGGIKPGEDLDGLSVEAVLKKLLYPYVAPSVSASTTPKNGGVFELGSSQTVTGITVNVTKKSETITKVEVFDGSSSLGVKSGGDVATGGAIQFTVNKAVTSNKNFKAIVTDAAQKTVTVNTGSFTFVSPYYMGICEANASLNEGLIKAMTKKIETKGNKSHSYTCNNQRAVIAYPKAYGDLRQILDPNSFDVTGTFIKQVVTITGLNEAPVEYNVYVSGAATVSGFAYRFNY